MKQLVLVMLLASTPAWAEWTLVRVGVDYDAYADLATIRRSGNMATMWSLLDFKSVQRVAGTAFLSRTARYEYDCDGARSRTLALVLHSENMGGGEVVYSDADPGQWTPVFPDSINEAVWKRTCKK